MFIHQKKDFQIAQVQKTRHLSQLTQTRIVRSVSVLYLQSKVQSIQYSSRLNTLRISKIQFLMRNSKCQIVLRLWLSFGMFKLRSESLSFFKSSAPYIGIHQTERCWRRLCIILDPWRSFNKDVGMFPQMDNVVAKTFEIHC
jgi:hypothetical protein